MEKRGEEREEGGRGEGRGGKGRGSFKICKSCWLVNVELTRALNWRHSATRSAKSSSPAPFPVIPSRSTLAILLRFGGRLSRVLSIDGFMSTLRGLAQRS